MPDLATDLTPEDDDAALEQAESIVRGFCGWVIAPEETVTVTVEWDGGCDLVLPSRFVTDVVSVTHLGSAITGWRLTSSGMLKGVSFPCGAIVVEFTHGFAADAVPPAVTRVVQSLAQRIQSQSGAGGVKSRQVGPFAESYGGELAPDEVARLTPYTQTLA